VVHSFFSCGRKPPKKTKFRSIKFIGNLSYIESLFFLVFAHSCCCSNTGFGNTFCTIQLHIYPSTDILVCVGHHLRCGFQRKNICRFSNPPLKPCPPTTWKLSRTPNLIHNRKLHIRMLWNSEDQAVDIVSNDGRTLLASN